VTISAEPNFHGRVRSPKAACIEGRKVVVHRQMAGPGRRPGSGRRRGRGWSRGVGSMP
jgi:hypothetical protein